MEPSRSSFSSRDLQPISYLFLTMIPALSFSPCINIHCPILDLPRGAQRPWAPGKECRWEEQSSRAELGVLLAQHWCCTRFMGFIPIHIVPLCSAGKRPASCAQAANLGMVMGGNQAVHLESTLLVRGRALMYAQPDAQQLLSTSDCCCGAPLPFCLSVGDLVTQKNPNLFTPSLCMPCTQCHHAYDGVLAKLRACLWSTAGSTGMLRAIFDNYAILFNSAWLKVLLDAVDNPPIFQPMKWGGVTLFHPSAASPGVLLPVQMHIRYGPHALPLVLLQGAWCLPGHGGLLPVLSSSHRRQVSTTWLCRACRQTQPLCLPTRKRSPHALLNAFGVSAAVRMNQKVNNWFHETGTTPKAWMWQVSRTKL